MKKNKIFIIVIITLILTYLNINSVINNLLNKKYIVDEIATTNTKKGLEGIQDSINLDYASFRWILFINSIYLILISVYLIYLIYQKKSKKV